MRSTIAPNTKEQNIDTVVPTVAVPTTIGSKLRSKTKAITKKSENTGAKVGKRLF
jgi:hypothetical protein